MTVITKVRADNNTVEIRALAVCKDGKCVMAEEDYKQLKSYVLAVKEMSEHNSKIEAQVNELLEALQAAVARCKADQHRHINHVRE